MPGEPAKLWEPMSSAMPPASLREAPPHPHRPGQARKWLEAVSQGQAECPTPLPFSLKRR